MNLNLDVKFIIAMLIILFPHFSITLTSYFKFQAVIIP